MEINRIVKPVVVGGVAAATMFSPIQPLRMLDVGNEVAYAANDITLPVSTFKPTGAKFYVGTTFQDVAANMWYTDAVKQAYEYGLITGKSANAYEPEGDLTVAETITLAVKLHSYGTTGGYNIPAGTNPWYNNIVNYAVQNGIITASEFMGQYDNKATREQVAHIFSKVFGEGMLPKINAVSSLPDVKPSDKYASDIYELYEAGILSGSDSKGTFNPKSNITRAEIASIVMRMALPTQRVSLDIFNGVGAPKSDTFPSVSNGAVSKPNTGSNSADTDNNNNNSNNNSNNSNSNNNNNSSTDNTTDNTTDKPNSGTNTNIGTTKPNSGTNTNTGTTKPNSGSSNNNNNNNTDKPSTPQPVTIDGIEYVPDVTGAYYVYCTSTTDLSKLITENNISVAEQMSPGISASDIVFTKSGEHVVIPLKAHSGMDFIYFACDKPKEGSTTPNPDEYADWFFNVYREGKTSSRVYDARPSNYQECALAIINYLRDQYNVPRVELSSEICKASEIRADELATSFSHDRPNGGDLYDLWLEVGFKKQNQAMGGVGEDCSTSKYLVNAMSGWIDSPGHLRPIIEAYKTDDYFTHIGIAYGDGGMCLNFGQVGGTFLE